MVLDNAIHLKCSDFQPLVKTGKGGGTNVLEFLPKILRYCHSYILDYVVAEKLTLSVCTVIQLHIMLCHLVRSLIEV